MRWFVAFLAALAVLPVAGESLGWTGPRSHNLARTRPARWVLAVGNSYDGTVDLIDARTLRRLDRPST